MELIPLEEIAMTFRETNWRPTPGWLAELSEEKIRNGRVPLGDLLEHSLFYPAAGVDGRPVQFLGGFVHSFVYVDYGMGQDLVEAEVCTEEAFMGYRLLARRNLSRGDLAPAGWQPQIPARFTERVHRAMNRFLGDSWIKPGFGAWYVFERLPKYDDSHGPSRFSLLYVGGDGAATYQSLYWRFGKPPVVLAIIQPGTGFGGNYDDYTHQESLLGFTVLQGPIGKPDYLVCGSITATHEESYWPKEYPHHVEYFQMKNGNGIWARKDLQQREKGVE